MNIENFEIFSHSDNGTNIIGSFKIKNKIYGFSVLITEDSELYSFSPEIRVGRRFIELQVRRGILTGLSHLYLQVV